MNLRSDAGFTLIEILAVLALSALVIALALPMMTGGSRMEMRSVAQMVATGLRETRDQAIDANRPMAMEVDVARRTIVLDGRTRELGEELQIRLVTVRSEKISAERGAIRFFPDGSSTGGRIVLAAGDATSLVDVDWLTGEVRIRDGSAEDWDAPIVLEQVHFE